MEEAPQPVDFSDELVSKIVRKKLQSEDFTLVDWKLSLVGQWIGLCGEHATLTVTLNGQPKPLSFFVKLYPRVDFVAEFIEETGGFRKETFVYGLFNKFEENGVNVLRTCVPACYHIQSKFLVMEDLAKDNYEGLNKNNLFDYDTMRVILDALAKLHASTLIYEEKTSSRLIDKYEAELQEGFFVEGENSPRSAGVEAAFKGIANCIKLFDLPSKLLSGKDFSAVVLEVCRRNYHLVKPSLRFRNVICHGDLWATNLLIRYDKDRRPLSCKLVDFQGVRYTPPAQDVFSVIYMNTSREFRDRYMYDLIGVYYTSLERHVTAAGCDMKKVLTFDDFLESCAEQKVFSLVQTACYFPLVLLDTKVVEKYFTGPNKECLLEDKSLLVAENMEKDESYKKRIYESILDLKDYCDYL